MHSDLSSHLHGPECNALIDALKKCHREHKFLKFIGHCNEADNAMLKCLRKERKMRQQKNHEKSLELKKRYRVLLFVSWTMEIEVPKIEEEIIAWEMRSFVDRYFRKRFISEKDGGRYCVLIHSNKMLLLTLAPSHPILHQNLTVTSINYQVSPTLNRLENKVSGKRKFGGQQLSETSIICEINCENDRLFKVRAGVVGKLIEVNAKLVRNPELIKDSNQGYMVIMSPRLHDMEAKLDNLLSEDPACEI